MRYTLARPSRESFPSERLLEFEFVDVKPRVAIAALLFLAVAGCQAPAPVAEPAPPVIAPEPKPAAPEPPPAPAPVVRVPTPSEKALADGIGLYDAGDYNGAIKMLLAAKPIWEDASLPTGLANKVAAHKYIALSYCVTNRRTLCRQQFVEAIKLDKNFQLEPAEKSHPIWGQEFERAKAQATAPPPPARRPAAAPTPPAKAP